MPTTPLLHRADERVRSHRVPAAVSVFVHGDVWGGNMLWEGDRCVALIDWKTAGVGDPGVDLGSLRMQMALQYGQEAPAHVLEGWQRQAGRAATAVPYWDAVAALNTPTVMQGWPGSPTTVARWTPRPSRSAATRSSAPPSISFRHQSADRGVADTWTPRPRSPDPSARSLRAHCGTLAQPSADALTPRALTDARAGPRPRALGVRGSDADARRPIDPGQGARRAHGTAFGRLDATTAGAGHAPPRHARGRSAPRVRGRAAGPAYPRVRAPRTSRRRRRRGRPGLRQSPRRRPDVRPCVPAPAGA